MTLKAYTTLTSVQQPKGFAGVVFLKKFSDSMAEFFEGIENMMIDHELNSKNDPISLGVYVVNSDLYALYNSEQTDLKMLQSMFELLEDIRDNERKSLQERAYAEALHTQLTASFVSTGSASVIYETR